MNPPGTSFFRTSRRYISILALIALLCMSVSPVQAQRGRRLRDRSATRTSPGVLAAFREVVAGPAKSLVRVQCDDKDVALGTIVEADGWVLTKASQLAAKPVCKLSDGRTFEAKVVGVDSPHDLALLKIDVKGLSPVQWKSSKLAAPGDWVASPGLSRDPVGIGVVSVAARRVSPREYPRTKGGYLGISGGTDNAEPGVRVREVQPRSAAARAGLEADDLIIAIAGKPVRDIESLQSILGRYRPRDEMTITVKRDGKEKELKATLDKWPAQALRSDIQNSMGSELSEKRVGFPNVLQHDTVLRPTDCGGPIVDLDGKTVGINIARAGRTESYAIPSDTVLSLLKDLKSGKRAAKSE
jgi:serine protease Do